MGTSLALAASCPSPGTNPVAPTATSCGLIGRDCELIRGTQPTCVVLADFDGDTDLDLGVVLYGSDSVAVWLNDGTGTFSTTQILPVGGTPSWAAAGDFDGDGDPDLAVVALAAVVGPAVSILNNQGNATFAPAVNFSAGSVSTFVAAGDLDGDGRPDLVAANEPADRVAVLLNNGNGTFAAPISLTAGQAPAWVALADLDGDDNLDLAVANRNSDNVSVLFNNGNGTFAAAVHFAAGDTPRAVAAADFDGDGDADLAVANEGGFDDPQPDNVSILVNAGAGAFSLAATLPVGVNPQAIATGDLDGDNDVDLVVANYGTNDETSTIGVLLNNGNGAFAPVVNWRTGSGPEAVVLGDLDGDGDLDAVTANYGGNDVSLLPNDGSGGFGNGD